MRSEDLFLLLGDVNAEMVESAGEFDMREKKKRYINKKKVYKFGMGAVACAAILVGSFWISDGLGVGRFVYEFLGVGVGDALELSEASNGVEVNLTEKVYAERSVTDLAWFSEEEMFGDCEFSNLIFKGGVEKIQNVVCDFNGTKTYKAILEIRVENVYRDEGVLADGEYEQGEEGMIQAGQIVKCLTNFPIDTSMWIEDTGTLSKLRTGMKGIFMVKKYDAESVHCENGATLALTDLAEYGFGDGVRWAFLEDGDELIFDRDAYAGAAKAQSLDEIEKYVQEMLK